MQMGDYEDVGLSLFRGMDTIQIEQDNEHLEEEAAEEQRRRNEELRSILKQTFADLSFDDDDEEDDDDDEDDSGADDGSSDSDDSRCRNNERQHQALAQTVLEESQILPPRPVTEGSVMFPENGHLTPQWDTSTNSELPPKICKESGEPHRGSPESSPERRPRLAARAAGAVTVTVPPAAAAAAVSDPNEVYRQAGYESAEQLRVLYEVRTREVQRLSREVEAARAEAAAEVDGLRRRIVSCEADKNGLQLQLGNARSLLAEHKGRTQELEDEVETMKRNIFNLENSKKQLETQLAAAQAAVVELQHKVLLLERSRLGDGREALRELEGRHRADVDALRRQLHECDARLREQEREAAEREGRLREQNREQERLLVEKGEAVAALARQLEEAQRGLGRAGALRAEAEAAQRDAQRASQQLEAAQRELEQLKSELKQYEVLDSLGLLSAGGDSTVDRGVRDSRGGGGFHAELRRELQRSLAGQKVKREEIRRLQEQLRERDRQLCERDRQVAALQRQQELYLQEADKFKEEVDKLYAQLAHRDSADGCADPDAEAARRDAETRRAELEAAKAEARDLAERLAAAEAELREAQGHAEANGREEFLRFHEQAAAKTKREHDERVAALQCQLEKAAEECDRVKRMYVEVCGSKELLLQGVQEERAGWEAERAELRREAAQLRARLDLYAGRVSREIDRAKEAAIAAVAAEDRKQPETCSVSVQATASPLPSPVPGGDGCASCEALRQRASFLEGRTEGLTEELCRRQAELRESRGRAASLQRELAQLAEKRESLEAEIVQYKQRLKDALQSQEEAKREEGQPASEERQEAGRRAAALEAEVERLRGESARAVAECGAARQRAESLQRELSACRAEAEVGAGASGRDAEEAARLRERLEEAERHVAESERRAAEVSVKLTAELTAARGLCEQLADRLQEGRVDKKDSETCTEWEYPDLEQLVARHREEIERIKDQTVDYFANQVLQLQEQHCASLAKAEQLYAESLQAARLAAVEAREEAAAARLGKEETEKHLVHVQKTLSEVKADLAHVRNKYHTAKKVVHDYKVWAQKREEQCRQEWRRLEEGYRASLLELQQRMDRVLDHQGKRQAPRDNS
ncbi:rootletin-like [Schistocerca serialis cubense]|uniref:rootletin-like n=1 Tax=Schistocerca serialis cubense TaxID=2023355 RepID=UPI00214F05E4|nr:rootletin-like [Schistocerca serialis cubense]